MVADKIDMSLDEIIAKNRRGGRGGRGGRGRGRGGGRGGSNNRRGSGPSYGGGPIKSGGRGNRSTPYNRPKSIPDKWEHDMFDGVGRRSSAGRRSEGGLSTAGVHLQVSNLDYGVTESDIRELFSEFGKLKKAMINYDESGRSHGTADVVFERKTDAQKAYTTYNGVPLDGRPMKLEAVSAQFSTNESSNSGRSSGFRLGNRGSGFRGNSRGGNRGSNLRSGGSRGFRGGRGRGGSQRGGRGRGRGQRDTPSKDQLDKELDSYIEKGDS